MCYICIMDSIWSKEIVTCKHIKLATDPCGQICFFFCIVLLLCRQGVGKYVPEDIDSSLCTHIAYGFAVMDGGTLNIKPHDSWADIDNSEFIINFHCAQQKLTDLFWQHNHLPGGIASVSILPAFIERLILEYFHTSCYIITLAIIPLTLYFPIF